MKYVPGIAGQAFRLNEGPGFGSAAEAPDVSEAAARLAKTGYKAPEKPGPPPPGLTVQGLPLVKPPYGVLSAINLDKGELMWMVPHGDTPDPIKQHPALKGLNIPKTGQAGPVGQLVTKTLVIVGDPGFVTYPDKGRGAMLRAYNKQTGAQVGAVWMPAPQSGSPMTYSVNGKQYVVVAISGANYSGEYVAFTLP